MLKDLFYLLMCWFEEKVQRKSSEYRRSTYKEFWPYFKRYGIYLGDLIEVDNKKFLAAGMSKGPGFYSHDSVPIQFRQVPIESNNITFLPPRLIARSKVVKHYSPDQFKQAIDKELRQSF